MTAVLYVVIETKCDSIGDGGFKERLSHIARERGLTPTRQWRFIAHESSKYRFVIEPFWGERAVSAMLSTTQSMAQTAVKALVVLLRCLQETACWPCAIFYGDETELDRAESKRIEIPEIGMACLKRNRGHLLLVRAEPLWFHVPHVCAKLRHPLPAPGGDVATHYACSFWVKAESHRDVLQAIVHTLSEDEADLESHEAPRLWQGASVATAADETLVRNGRVFYSNHRR